MIDRYVALLIYEMVLTRKFESGMGTKSYLNLRSELGKTHLEKRSIRRCWDKNWYTFEWSQ